MARSKIGKTSDFPQGMIKSIEVDGRNYAVANVGGSYYAVDGLCPHANGELGEGRLEGTTLKCPKHGAEFDLLTGKNLKKPHLPFSRATDAIRTYKVVTEGEDVFLDI